VLEPVGGKDGVIDILIYLYTEGKGRARTNRRGKTVIYIIY